MAVTLYSQCDQVNVGGAAPELSFTAWEFVPSQLIHTHQ